MLQDALGFDYGSTFNDGSIVGHLKEAAPAGIDVYFDNVGAAHLQAAIMCMRPNGRIPLCGAIATYNDTEARPGPNNLSMAIGLGLTLRGFIVSHFMHMAPPFRAAMEAWVGSGAVTTQETVYQRMEHAPAAFLALFSGAHTGKMIVTF